MAPNSPESRPEWAVAAAYSDGRRDGLTVARGAILAEIDDMDPDHHMRNILDDPDRPGDPGIAGNAWWRAYVEVAAMRRALNAIQHTKETP